MRRSFSCCEDPNDTTRLASCALKVSALLLKIILFPWGLYSLCKWGGTRFALNQIYPSQNLPKDELFQWRKEQIDARNKNGHIFRHIRLEKKAKATVIHGLACIDDSKWEVGFAC